MSGLILYINFQLAGGLEGVKLRTFPCVSIEQHNSIKMLSAALEVAYIKAGFQGAGRLVIKFQGNPKAVGRY